MDLYSDVSVIVPFGDQGVTDRTMETLSKFEETILMPTGFPNIRARQEGIDFTSKEYILFLDADDSLIVDFPEMEDGKDFYFMDILTDYPTHQVVFGDSDVRSGEEWKEKFLNAQMPASLVGRIMRKSLVSNLKIENGFLEDLQFWTENLLRFEDCKVDYLFDVQYVWDRSSKDSMSQDFDEDLDLVFTRLGNYKSMFKSNWKPRVHQTLLYILRKSKEKDKIKEKINEYFHNSSISRDLG